MDSASSRQATPPSANELAAERTNLALQRTLMAADRSLMAWVRTSLSMTSFGFTIYKLLQGMEKAAATPLTAEATPRVIGLFLTGMGTVAMVMGAVEYWYRLRQLRTLSPFKTLQPSFIMALVMSVTGLVLFIGIIFRVL